MADVATRYDVRVVPVEATAALRHDVLRPHQTIEEMVLPGESDPGTTAFAAVAADGAVVGTAVVLPEPCPWRPDRRDGWRLRGMATAPEWRGQGVGTRVLGAAIDHVADNGGGLVWCHARTPARSLYERAGFAAYGDVWDEPVIGPHIGMWREVAAR